MLKKLFTGVFGTRHDREAKRLLPLVAEINEIAESLQSLSEEELRGQTEKLRGLVRERTGELEARLAELRETKKRSEDSGERESLALEMREVEDTLKEELQAALDDILPEAFATVKEVCRRLVGTEVVVTGQTLVWDMVPYDVQLIGGTNLHQGRVSEMATGEGKTLVATMPLYLNALAGRGVHLVTVNTYLAQRDSEWMGAIYRYLGLTVDCIDLHEPGSPERRQAYLADITYGTNNEYGFDYLRDNMVHTLEQRVQRGHAFAIIDEVDSILIDEARTPLIISGPVAQEQSDVYRVHNTAVSNLFRQQTRLVNELIAEAERELEEGDTQSAGEKLLAARRGAPKNKRLSKLFAEDPGLQKLVAQTEAFFMRDKSLHEVDELLLFAMDEKGHNVHLSDKGLDTLSPGEPEAFVVPDLSEAIGEIERDPDLSVDEKRDRIKALEHEYAEKSQKIHAIHQLLKAYALFNRDEQYIVEGGDVVIVDEFTGRKMAGRRWSDGLHQAVEAKEGVTVRGETQTLATITIQNYFRMYDKLAGMTGTAETEEGEFHQIYNLDVGVIPTNRPIVREDRHDLVYRTKREKYNAILDEIERLHRMQLPVLVGTVSVDVSETFSRMLKRRGIPHNVLNAKYHKQEAEIVASAGQPGAVTIATNMAGRGTDIKLGAGVTDARTVGWLREQGVDLSALMPADPAAAQDLAGKQDDFVVEVGGLHIIGSERIASIMERMGAQEGEVITHPLVTRSIERAQRRVEMQNFESRKRLLDYDDVMNQQREVIYDLRLFALEGGDDLRTEVWEMVEAGLSEVIPEYVDSDMHPEEWDLAGLRNRLVIDYFLVVDKLPARNDIEHDFESADAVKELILGQAREGFKQKLQTFGDLKEQVLSYVLLGVIDEKWKDHLYDLDHLKASIGFRGWGQKDPLVEYKKEAYDMFVDLMRDIRKSVSSLVFRAQIAVEPPAPPPLPRRLVPSGPGDAPETGVAGGVPVPEEWEDRTTGPMTGGGRPMGRGAFAGMRPVQQTDVSRLRTNHDGGGDGRAAPVTAERTVGRNDPCPCGSGRKYKRCCGR
jgi:preprotein translocase subunit SecA